MENLKKATTQIAVETYQTISEGLENFQKNPIKAKFRIKYAIYCLISLPTIRKTFVYRYTS